MFTTRLALFALIFAACATDGSDPALVERSYCYYVDTACSGWDLDECDYERAHPCLMDPDGLCNDAAAFPLCTEAELEEAFECVRSNWTFCLSDDLGLDPCLPGCFYDPDERWLPTPPDDWSP